MKELYTVNGFHADVLEQSKEVIVYGDNFMRIATYKLEPKERAKPKAYLKRHPEAKRIRVIHYRYLSYNLRSVMTQRSGAHYKMTDYVVLNGQLEAPKYTTKSEIY